MATFTADANGQLIATSVPISTRGFTQQLSGSPLDAAANKTIASQQAQAEQVKALGAGQKGSGKKRRRRGGGASIPQMPEAGTIPGVSFANNHVSGINTLNQLRASGAYDKLANAPPVVKVGGRTKKRSRKSKRNGRSSKRTSRRGIHKRGRHIRRTSRVL